MKYQNKLADKDQTISYLWRSVLLFFITTCIATAGWITAPSRMVVHIPPDLSKPTVMRPGEVGPANAYGFALFVWREVNRWGVNGLDDYPFQINALREYMTPSCYQKWRDDYEGKKERNELFNRVRSVTEIPGRIFSRDRVRTNARDKSWTVSLDLQTNESVSGKNIKTRFFNYQVDVVAWDVNPQYNVYGLALDCLSEKPTKIEVSES